MQTLGARAVAGTWCMAGCLGYNWGERERAPSCGLNGRAVTIDIYTLRTRLKTGFGTYIPLSAGTNFSYFDFGVT